MSDKKKNIVFDNITLDGNDVFDGDGITSFLCQESKTVELLIRKKNKREFQFGWLLNDDTSYSVTLTNKQVQILALKIDQLNNTTIETEKVNSLVDEIKYLKYQLAIRRKEWSNFYEDVKDIYETVSKMPELYQDKESTKRLKLIAFIEKAKKWFTPELPF